MIIILSVLNNKRWKENALNYQEDDKPTSEVAEYTKWYYMY
jgi:hypothetical protein